MEGKVLLAGDPYYTVAHYATGEVRGSEAERQDAWLTSPCLHVSSIYQASAMKLHTWYIALSATIVASGASTPDRSRFMLRILA